MTLPPISCPGFSLVAADHDGTLSLTLEGSADLNAKDALDEFFRLMHAEVQRTGVRGVTVDLRKLEFMNSSCFKVFVTWINLIQELEGPTRYRVKFQSSPAILWQRRSLHALQCFASELVSIEAV